ncbi:hypothetical protein EC973_008359 [Apophysomyces ossiformis]|uniref:UBX domain-containing protein n=1 Tax=Apophysomyces ossiformis TaxID=679940 RepID=A0A8H7BTW4_9FUNG|nr:hypothetical protein EC973_008359 [Apophysomyces ossiformis]
MAITECALLLSQKAWKATNGAGLQPAMDWILSHPEVSDEPDMDEPPAAQALGSAPTSASETAAPGTSREEEGEIKEGEQTAQSLICNDCQKLFRDATAAERHAIRTQHQNFSESTQAIAPLTEEEKRAKLAELKARLAEKRALKVQADAEEARQQEKVRRRTGQEMSAIKEQMEAKEMKRAFDAKKKEKEEERIARAKIKAQIEADKKERLAKKEAAKKAAQAEAEASAAQPVQTPGVPKEYKEARLQIRIPGAAPITQTFGAEATLTDVQSFLQEKGCNGTFTLSTTFPRKTFGQEDLSKTLKELNLVPSSALMLTYI